MKPFHLLLIVCLLLLNGGCIKPGDPCSDNTGPHTDYHYLSPAIMAQSPYFKDHNFDTLIYASNTGDTFEFVQPIKDTLWFTQLKGGLTPSCPQNKYDSYQIIHSKYKCIKGGGVFEIWYAEGKEVYLKNTNTEDFNIEIIELKINSYHFIFFLSRVGNTSVMTNIPSIIINGRNYKDSQKGYQEYNDTTKVSYVNVTNGVYHVIDYSSNSGLSLINH